MTIETRKQSGQRVGPSKLNSDTLNRMCNVMGDEYSSRQLGAIMTLTTFVFGPVGAIALVS